MKLQRLLILAVWSAATTSAVGQWNITQVTDNDYPDYYPNISGGNIVWLGRRPLYQQVLLYDGSTVTQLTDDDRTRSVPRVSGDNVAWSANDGSYGAPSQIMLYNGTTTVPLTGLDGFAHSPIATGPYVVWRGGENPKDDIYRYDGTTTTQIMSGQVSSVKASGEYIAWTGLDSTGGYDQEVFLFDGSSITQITHNDVNDRFPVLYENRIAWQTEDTETLTGPDGEEISYYEVAYYDGTEVIQLTDNLKIDTGIAISDGGVVWQTRNGNDYNVYYFDGTSTQMLASDGLDLTIEGSRICWVADGPTDDDLYVWDNGVTTRISNPGFTDGSPSISGDTIAWLAFDGSDGEVFTAVPEPTTLCLLISGGLAMLRRRYG